MNIDQSLPQSNPSIMVPAGGSLHHPTAEPTYVVLPNPPIPFPYNGSNLTCEVANWPQPPNPPNHDSNNMVQQPDLRPIQQPIFINMSAQAQPMNPMIGAPTVQPPPNHDLQETQQTPSKSAPSPSPSPCHSLTDQKNYPPSFPIQKRAPTAGSGLRKQKMANAAGNLANLLPTGTVLVFQALIPSFTGNGKCQIFNKYLVGFVIAFCAATCFLSSFTDSLQHGDKLYYGFATCKGLCVFNYDNRPEEEGEIKKELEKLKIETLDFVHAFGSLFVFLIFAVSSTDVLLCFFPEADHENEYSIVIYLPLVAGALSSFLFSICPTKRKGLGYADTPRR
ncbi:protein DMP10-like [Corylus avellana]|uniref:protein DMP10-like n=1 Tax=Corylus avellana TaxID=13451 RepID=UPI00286BB81C|nr:protein DMP10-like [Corylus avellana]